MNPRLFPALFMLCASALFAAEKTAVPFRALSFDAACEAAAAEHKIVFIDFFTTWCGPCKELDRTTKPGKGCTTLRCARDIRNSG